MKINNNIGGVIRRGIGMGKASEYAYNCEMHEWNIICINTSDGRILNHFAKKSAEAELDT